MSSYAERVAYRIGEYAESVGPVSTRTVWNWIRLRGLRVTYIGGIPMILAEDGAEFIGRQRKALSSRSEAA